ncbi:MAG: TIGR02099 family protein [Gammaproteobacteria bacterium]|nr:TIGR02099 family protein [Gammaproteobacteria bacterium]
MILILLAVIVGLFRLFLPRLPEYQDEIKAWASDAIGMQVEFSGMNARWALSGPELEFYDAELVRPDNQKRAIAASRVGIGISVGRLLFDQKFEVDRLTISETSIEIRQLEGGGWWVQGTPVSEVPKAHEEGPRRLGNIEIVGESIEIGFLQPGDARPRIFRVPRVLASLDENRVAVDAAIRLPDDLGADLEISATQLLGVALEDRSWDVSFEGDDVLLGGWADLHPAGADRVLSGTGDVALSLALDRNGVRTAIADIDLAGVELEGGAPFDVEGRLEFDLSADGWLVAADDFRISTEDREWPASSLGVEASVEDDGSIAVLGLRATYLDLGDHALVLAVLPEEVRAPLAELAPGGKVRNMTAIVADLDGERPQYSVTASLDGVGFNAVEQRPGVRNFTGYIRADQAGGRVEIEVSDMLLDLPSLMNDPVDIDAMQGTVMWRNRGDRITVFSDSIRLTNPALDARINLDLSINADGSAPEIDLVSTYTVRDIGAVRRYLPRKIIKAKLDNWLQTALVSGSIERGTAELKGPLDRFPFENGEGSLRVEGSARNVTLKYHPDWPAAEQANVEVVLDNQRLYSERNRSMHAGNLAVDTSIEIPNLRRPVLAIDGLVTGTLQSLRQFALQSPIDRFTGGNLSRVDVSGEASFDLDLIVPLKSAKDTAITGLLRSNNGTLSVAGLGAPITDLIGEVTITRDTITAESLGGRFLGEDVDFRLGPGQDARFFTVATATGTATAEAVINELGVPLEGLIEGAAPYEARLLFPRGRQDAQPPFTIRIASPLRGMALKLPEPVGKTADESMLLRGDIRFMPGGERIESEGLAGDDLAWQLLFTRLEGAWDLDRGVVVSGGGAIEPAETRGLHLRGRTETFRLDEWLSLSREGEKRAGVADRIRSADLIVDNLFAIGQHLRGHRVKLDRSARDWLVQLDGKDVKGSVFVPYDFASDRAMVLEMDRLSLPGDEVSPPADARLDPRKLPPIKLTAAEFALGDRYFGAVRADLARTSQGLETNELIAQDASFEIVARGSWVADDREELGSRTYVSASLTSTDVGTTLGRLDFAQGVTGDSMNINIDLSWGGGPRAEFLEFLDGEVQLRLEGGELEEVEPGAGRMLGLFSFVALPRRLSLDFRDVFARGFSYDTISGSFRVEDGVASTCDMSLEGPSADVGIVGQVDLVTKEYEQGAIISAKVGNTLPIVGAVVGGPPGAAVMLIFSQIFKKPLEEAGQVFYGMSGPWDEPVIESVSSENLVRYGELAGCLANGQEGT